MYKHLFETLEELQNLYKEYPKTIISNAVFTDEVFEQKELCIPPNATIEVMEMPSNLRDFIIGKVLCAFDICKENIACKNEERQEG